jgi:hypothetical protein
LSRVLATRSNTDRPAAKSPVASLLPKEHGAYGMLGVPLLTALASGRPRLSAVLLSLGAVAAFLVHEPLLVLLGERGARHQAVLSPVALRYAAGITTVGVAAFVVGWLLASGEARLAALIPAALGALSLAVAARGQERTTVGEIAVAVALAAWSVSVALAGGAVRGAALALWGIFAGGHAALILAVQGIIQFRKNRAGLRAAALLTSPAIALAGWLAWPLTGTDAWAPLLLAVFCAVAIGLAAASPHPRHLKRVGSSVIGASAVSTTLAIVALR